MIKVFSSPTCAPCALTKRFLDSRGIKYEVKEAWSDEHQPYIEQYGRIIPLVVSDSMVISGYNPSMLQSLVSVLGQKTENNL
jgi:glutaredoxin